MAVVALAGRGWGDSLEESWAWTWRGLVGGLGLRARPQDTESV